MCLQLGNGVVPTLLYFMICNNADLALTYIPDEKDLSEIPQLQKRPIVKPLRDHSANSNNRDEAILKVFESGGYSLKEIGDHFGLHYSTVSRIVRQREKIARNET